MTDWSPLRTELAIWRAEGRSLPIWWRDDDAVEETAALDQLLDLAERTGVPVHLAVIPQFASQSLAKRCAATPWAVPIVHGWSHQNHAPAGQKKSEFGHQRPGAATDAAAAISQMEKLFGPTFVKVFVPPWNRIAPEVIGILPDLGYIGVSTFTPRQAHYAQPGLTQINTHIDPMDWRGSRGLIPPEQIIQHMVTLLRDRRAGKTDAIEPLGLLTHHLVHNPVIWSFTKCCLMELLEGGATPTNLLLLKENLP